MRKVVVVHRFAVAVLVLLVISALPPGLMRSAAQPTGDESPWSVPVRVDGGPRTDEGTSFVRLAVDPDGNPHVTWLEDREGGTDCFVSSSGDGGATWSEDLRPDPKANQPRNTPTTCDIGTDDEGNLYVAYCQWVVTQGWWRVRWVRSTDGGTTFRDPSDAYHQVTETIAQEHPAMAIAPSGSVHLVYVERTPKTQKVLYVRSDDGLNPQPPQAIDVDMPETETHVQADIALGPDGQIYIAYGYRDPDGSGLKMAVRESVTTGFEIKRVVYYGGDVPRSLRPGIAVSSEGVIEIVFDPEDGNDRILHTRSADGGDTFSTPARVSVQGASYEAQSSPDLAFDSLGSIHVVWTQETQGSTRVYHSLSYDGKSFTPSTLLTGAWDADEMGPMGREDKPSLHVLPSGTVMAAFSASLNRTVGVWFATLQNRPPVVTITTPLGGTTVKGLVTVSGTADDPEGGTGLEAVYLRVGDDDPVRLPGTTSWQHSFNSNVYADGPLPIVAYASDGFMTGPEVVVNVVVENNMAPRLNLARPENASEHSGVVHVVGSAQDTEGFGDGTTVQWRLGADGAWVDDEGWELQNDNVMDFEFDLQLSQLPTGPVSISVRVSDGARFCAPHTKDIRLVNKPDLRVDAEWVAFDIKEPMHEDLLTITVTVRNVGVAYSGPYVLEFWRFNVKEGSETGTNLSAGDEEDLIFVWETFAGVQDLRFQVDPADLVDELDESNNEATVELTVGKASDEDGDSGLPWLPIVLAIVGIVVVAGGAVYYMKWKTDTMPANGGVRVVYEGQGLYSEESGPYAQGGEGGDYLEDMPDRFEDQDQNVYQPLEDTSSHGGAEHVEEGGPRVPRMDLPDHATEPIDTPSMDSEDPSQLEQDVTIDPEKVERA